jgi:proline dehydrogenase
MLRQTFLALSRQRALRHWMETSPRALRLTRRFIAGSTIDAGLDVVRRLHAERLLATLDRLGENVSTPAEAELARLQMEHALASIAAAGLPATVSIKLTQFGLDLGDQLCLDNASALVAAAARVASRVEIDMESSAYVDRTLAIVERLFADNSCLRCVLQAYLYRTPDDVQRMNRLRVPIRLCKGAYNEPRSVAHPSKSAVDRAYRELAFRLLDEGTYPAFATHDPRLIDAIIARCTRSRSDFEFQMLYGIRRDLQAQLAAQGYRVRLYVPYGDAWYPYFMRRLAERPANVFFIARNLLRA